MRATARRSGTGCGTASATRRSGGSCGRPARGNSTGSSCHTGRAGELRVTIRLLVEPSVGRNLLQLEPLHRNGVERASLYAQRAADTALFVEDHRRSLLPAVGLLDLGQEAFRLELVD